MHERNIYTSHFLHAWNEHLHLPLLAWVKGTSTPSIACMHERNIYTSHYLHAWKKHLHLPLLACMKGATTPPITVLVCLKRASTPPFTSTHERNIYTSECYVMYLWIRGAKSASSNPRCWTPCTFNTVVQYQGNSCADQAQSEVYSRRIGPKSDLSTVRGHQAWLYTQTNNYSVQSWYIYHSR